MRTGPRTGFRWTPETIVYAIVLWHRKNSRPPLTSDWEQAGENHPSRQTVRPRPRGRQPKGLLVEG
jgi:hypothetical protein